MRASILFSFTDASWMQFLDHLNLPSALVLRPACRQVCHLVQLHGRALKLGCKIRPFLGTESTTKCIRFLGNCFPCLNQLSVRMYPSSQPLDSTSEIQHKLNQLSTDQMTKSRLQAGIDSF